MRITEVNFFSEVSRKPLLKKKKSQKMIDGKEYIKFLHLLLCLKSQHCAFSISCALLWDIISVEKLIYDLKMINKSLIFILLHSKRLLFHQTQDFRTTESGFNLGRARALEVSLELPPHQLWSS